jgi:hypothetical protein
MRLHFHWLWLGHSLRIPPMQGNFKYFVAQS